MTTTASYRGSDPVPSINTPFISAIASFFIGLFSTGYNVGTITYKPLGGVFFQS